jgi:hypothetical protein
MQISEKERELDIEQEGFREGVPLVSLCSTCQREKV